MELTDILQQSREDVLRKWMNDLAEMKSNKLSLLEKGALAKLAEEAYDGLVYYAENYAENAENEREAKLTSFVKSLLRESSVYAPTVGDLQKGISLLRDRTASSIVESGNHGHYIRELNEAVDYIYNEISDESQKRVEGNVLVIAGAIMHSLGNMNTPIFSGLQTILNLWPADDEIKQAQDKLNELKLAYEELHNPKRGRQIDKESQQTDTSGIERLLSDNALFKEFLDNALHNAVRLNEVVEDFKQLQKLVNIKDSIMPTPIYQVARDVYGHYGIRAVEKGLKFEMEIDSNVKVKSYKDLLEMAFKEMVGNAIKYTPDGGSVRITGEKLNGFYKVNIGDSGIGIAKEELEKIWWPLYRANAVRDTYPGSGVGLFTDKIIIEAMGGFIGVESEEGKGSKFFFGLPVVK